MIEAKDNVENEREIVQISEHLYYYADDEYEPLIKSQIGLKNARFVKNDTLRSMNLSEKEIRVVNEFREFHNTLEGFKIKIEDPRADEYKKVLNELIQKILKNGSEITTIQGPKTTNNKITVEKGELTDIAIMYGIPAEVANLFFAKIEGKLYIMNPGLLYMAQKKGYDRIEIIDEYDEKTGEWIAHCKIYPKINENTIESISKLTPENQAKILEYLTQPTNGIGRASEKNVKTTKMYPFLRELAQTRALNRALRSFTGYGATSYEELPENEMVGD